MQIGRSEILTLLTPIPSLANAFDGVCILLIIFCVSKVLISWTYHYHFFPKAHTLASNLENVPLLWNMMLFVQVLWKGNPRT